MARKGAAFCASYSHQEELARDKRQFLQKTQGSRPATKVATDQELPSSPAPALSLTPLCSPSHKQNCFFHQEAQHPGRGSATPGSHRCHPPAFQSQSPCLDQGWLAPSTIPLPSLPTYLSELHISQMGTTEVIVSGKKNRIDAVWFVPEPRIIITLDQARKPSGRVQKPIAKEAKFMSQFYPRKTIQPITIFLQETGV